MNILEKFKQKNKVVLITGGGRGIGACLAEGFADVGAHIVIVDLLEHSAQETATKIKEKYHVETLALALDITKESEVQKMVQKVLEKFSTIDVLVNNAGVSIHEPVESSSYDNWVKVIDINLNAVYLCSKEIGIIMKQQGGGTIINISSMSANIVNYPQKQASYNASKAGVSHLTKSLAMEWAPYNTRVNAIAPGYMMTDMTREFINRNQDMTQKYWIDPTPMQRIGEPQELQGMAIYLASELASFTTGAIMTVDGGYSII